MRRWRLVLLLLAILPIAVARADSRVYLPMVARVHFDRPVIWGTVTHIVDGDTFDVRLAGCPLDRVRIRPIGIDTPERGECYYSEAAALLGVYMTLIDFNGTRTMQYATTGGNLIGMGAESAVIKVDTQTAPPDRPTSVSARPMTTTTTRTSQRTRR